MGDMVSFSLSGRTSRRHYWAALLLLTLLGVAVESVQDFLFGITISETGFNVATGFLSAAGLLIGWLTITLFVRRFHDIDRTGWWALSVFIPFFVPVGVIVLGCLRGSDGMNRYGAQPGQTPQASGPEDTVRLLEELAHLKEAGAVTDEEYEAQKKRILNGH